MARRLLRSGISFGKAAERLALWIDPTIEVDDAGVS